MIHYTIGSRNPAAHYFDIELNIEAPDPAGQVVRLPAWIPGSYMIRDFARHIVEISASSDGRQLGLTQLDKSSHQVEACSGPITLHYRVYAWDLSVRGAHLDTTHGFFNGTSVFLEVLGQSDQPCRVVIQRPAHEQCAQWLLATTLPRTSGDEFGFGEFEASDYAELIDHPVEMGCFERVSFEAGGIPHDVVLTGRFSLDHDILARDLSKICAAQIELFGPPAPMPRYLFLVMVVGNGYGGLEHRASTALMCSRKDLPPPGMTEPSAEYRQFLGLCSHEYFHSWNVKRIKPRALAEAELVDEVYTPLLWAFEGITSYYDDLMVVRSGAISTEQYLETLGQTITRVQRGRGRLRQSAATSSFNAWTKFYQQDENAANAIVSYYAKGSLIALCIDLRIRQLTDGDHSLDDVMRCLWQHYLDQGSTVADHDIQKLVCEVAGTDLMPELDAWIYAIQELPLTELLASVGIELKYRAASGPQDKGGKAEEKGLACSLGAGLKPGDGGVQLATVEEEGAAQKAGLAAGDIVIAIDGLKAGMDECEAWLKQGRAGDRHQISAFRRDELMHFEVELAAAPENTAYLVVADPQPPAFQAWLKSHPDEQ